ncbi:MAG TPA: hypothetical protein PKC47_00590 [Petrimonas sp.]|nr:hypothetical protein [Petrimonas sp.]
MKKATLCIFLLLWVSINLNAQVTRMNLTASAEYSGGWFNVTSMGLNFEHQVSNHWGMVLGAEKINYIHQYFTMSRVSVPVMVKFFSKPVNIAVGPYADLFTGLKSPMEITDIQADDIYWGFLGDISHRFDLNSKFSVEPGIRMRYGLDEFHIGLNAALKYTF